MHTTVCIKKVLNIIVIKNRFIIKKTNRIIVFLFITKNKVYINLILKYIDINIIKLIIIINIKYNVLPKNSLCANLRKIFHNLDHNVNIARGLNQ